MVANVEVQVNTYSDGLTKPQAAALLGISVDRIDQLLRDGRLDYTKERNYFVRISRESVLTLIEERERKAQSRAAQLAKARYELSR